jgi:hypothetical protein
VNICVVQVGLQHFQPLTHILLSTPLSPVTLRPTRSHDSSSGRCATSVAFAVGSLPRHSQRHLTRPLLKVCVCVCVYVCVCNDDVVLSSIPFLCRCSSDECTPVKCTVSPTALPGHCTLSFRCISEALELVSDYRSRSRCVTLRTRSCTTSSSPTSFILTPFHHSSTHLLTPFHHSSTHLLTPFHH